MVCLSMLSLKQFIIKQLSVSDFVISRLIKVSVSVISLRPRLGWSLVCYILWVLSTSKKPIGIFNLKPWTEFDFTPLNRYLRPQLSFISEETPIVSSVTLLSPLEMLSNPVNLPCGTKCWREFNIFWSGYFAFVLFIIIVIIIINIIIIIIIILLKLICVVVKDWFFSLGIYFCVFQEVAFNYNLCVNLHVEIQVKNKKGNK